MRLDKFLSEMGAGTRRELKQIIRKGGVTVDGQVMKDPGMAVTEKSVVTFMGEPVSYSEFEYYMMNKPYGVITATEDPRQKTVMDLMEGRRRKDLFPVGRLDKDTVGLLLITNDGVLNHELLSPAKHVDKTYFVKLDGTVDENDVRAFEKGVRIDDEFKALPAVLHILNVRKKATEEDISDYERSNAPESDLSHGISEVTVTIREGKYHQVKKMFHAVGKEVIYLKRISMGPLQLDESLAEGEYRKLTAEEVALLKR